LPDIALRSTTEEYARDSFENFLFSICRFREYTNHYPDTIRIVSWAFKEKRYDLHREALRFPLSRFEFHYTKQPKDITAAQKGETKTIIAFKNDPYGTTGDLNKKRTERNPFHRVNPYPISCPEIECLLHHQGPEIYKGELPW